MQCFDFHVAALSAAAAAPPEACAGRAADACRGHGCISDVPSVLSDQRATLPGTHIMTTTYFDGGLFSSVARTGTVHDRTGAVVLMPRTRN